MEDKKLALDIKVSILLDDIKEGQKLSQAFKEIGIIPFFYQDLKTFWADSLESIPRLSIVDVKKMNEGSLLLKNHPLVRSEEMPLVFFYSKETAPLLLSTYDIFHMGSIQKSSRYQGVLRILLKRLNKFENLERAYSEEKIKQSRYEDKITKLIAAQEEYREIAQKKDCLQKIISSEDKWKEEKNFFDAFAKIVEEIQEIDSFSFLEIGNGQQRLVSPHGFYQKFKTVPPLWLGQSAQKGIGQNGIDLASQVAIDVLGGEIITLYVKGIFKDPEKLIFLKINDQSFFKFFPWEEFESFLGGLFSFFLLRMGTVENDGDFLSPWELLSTLDQYRFGKVQNEQSIDPDREMHLIEIDFERFLSSVMKNRKLRFYWKSFFANFSSELLLETRKNFKMVNWGVQKIYLLVPEATLDLIFNKVQKFVSNFPLWKSFDDIDIFLTEDLSPFVRMVPFSVEALIHHDFLDKDIFKKKSLETPKNTEQFWALNSRSQTMDV